MLTIRDLKKSYDGKSFVLKGLNLEIEQGELVVVIGPSGAGKSTFIRCLNRIVAPTSGEITFNEISVTAAGRKTLKHVRTKMGMIFQHFNLIDRSSVLKNVLHGCLGQMSFFKSLFGLYTEAQKREAIQLLKTVGLADYKYKKAGALSGGQMQRVGICRALMQNPLLLLADEPIASLDPASAKSVMDYIQKVTKERALTCIINLHQVEFAKKYATRIIGLKNGNVIFDGPPANLTDAMIADIYENLEAETPSNDHDPKETAKIPLSDENPIKKAAKLAAFLTVAFMSFYYLEINVGDILTSLPNLILFFANNFWPPNFSNFTAHLPVVLDTFLFAIVGTYISAAVAFLFGILMSEQMNPIPLLRNMVRFFVSFFRNVPLLIWASLMVYIFGIGPIVGLVALTLATLGFLARSYAESMNEIAGNKLEALKASGASYGQILVHGLLPEFIPAWINWTLFSFEINIRASGVLGMVGAGGLGLLIQTHLDLRNYRSALSLIMILTALVLLTEVVVNYLRYLVEKQKTVQLPPVWETILWLTTVITSIGLFFLSIHLLNLDFARFLSRLANANEVIAHFLALNPAALPEIMSQLLISIALGICGLVVGCLISVVLAFLAADNITFSKPLSMAIKSVISIIRAIPSLVLILMVAASMGFGYTSGVVGLVFATVGYLTKAFMSSIEEQSPELIEAMKATGASWLQIITEGIFPNVKSAFLSWISIRLESNISDSISLGVIGAGGIGMLLSRAIRQHNFPQISTIILVIFLAMILVEASTNQLKKKLG